MIETLRIVAAALVSTLVLGGCAPLGSLHVTDEPAGTYSIEQATTMVEDATGDDHASAELLQRLGPQGLLETLAVAISRGQDGHLLVDQIQQVFHAGEAILARRGLSQDYAQGLIGAVSDCSHQGQALSAKMIGLGHLISQTSLSVEFLTSFGTHLQDVETHNTSLTSAQPWTHCITPSHLDAVDGNWSQADLGSAFMQALAINPHAGWAYLTGDRENLSLEEALKRQQFWIHYRDWSTDGFTSLMGALHTVITHPTYAHTQQAKRLMASSVEFLTHRHSTKELAPDTIAPHATSLLAHILITNMASVDYALNAGGSFPNDHSHAGQIHTDNEYFSDFMEVDYLADVEESDLEVLISLAGSTPQGRVTLVQGLVGYLDIKTELVITHQVESSAVDDWFAFTQALRQVMVQEARLMGFFAHAATSTTHTSEAATAIAPWVGLVIEETGQVFVDHERTMHKGIEPLITDLVNVNTQQHSHTELPGHNDHQPELQELLRDLFSWRSHQAMRLLYTTPLMDPDLVETFDAPHQFVQIVEAIHDEDSPLQPFFQGGFPDSEVIQDNQDPRNITYAVEDSLSLPRIEYALEFRNQLPRQP